MAKEKNVEGKLTNSFRGFVAAFLFVALAGCGGLKDDTGTEEVPDEPKTGVLAVSIITENPVRKESQSQQSLLQASLTDSPLLTAIPDISLFDYEFWFKNTSTNEELHYAKSATSGTYLFTLNTGTYTLKVKAFPAGTLVNSDGTTTGIQTGNYDDKYYTSGTELIYAIADGESSQFGIIPGTTGTSSPTVDVTLIPIIGIGSGSFEYTITWPGNANIDTLKLTPYSGGSIISLTKPSTSGTKGKKEQIKSGYYIFQIELSDASGTTTGKPDIVHIYNGLTTIYSAEFDEDDFASVPTDGGQGFILDDTWKDSLDDSDLTINLYNTTVSQELSAETILSEPFTIDGVTIRAITAVVPAAIQEKPLFKNVKWYLNSTEVSTNGNYIMEDTGLSDARYALTVIAENSDGTPFSRSVTVAVVKAQKLAEKLGESYCSVSGSTVRLNPYHEGTVNEDVTVPEKITLEIPSSTSLTVNAKTIIVNGALTVSGTVNAGTIDTVGEIIINSGGRIEAKTISRETGSLTVYDGGTLVTDIKGSVLQTIVGTNGYLQPSSGGSYIKFSSDGLYHFSGNVTLRKTFEAGYTSGNAKIFTFDSSDTNVLTINIPSSESATADGYSGIIMRINGTGGTDLSASDFFDPDTKAGTITITGGPGASPKGVGFWYVSASNEVIRVNTGGKITVNWPD